MEMLSHIGLYLYTYPMWEEVVCPGALSSTDLRPWGQDVAADTSFLLPWMEENYRLEPSQKVHA